MTTLGARLLCLLYETVLVGGMVMCTGLVYGIMTDQRQSMQGRLPLQLLIFAVIAAYFIGFWSNKRGQTLAMKTWHLRVVTADGSPLSAGKATQRFVLSWLWIAPGALAFLLHNTPPTSPGTLGLMLGLSLLFYAGLARLLPDRQCLHDVLCHTRLIKVPK
ncbi:RDD family protein [Leptothrix ochracea]|uniref:RDD family protein n=1 Tax=Leptothrix ochracea TaxID=735331 RepID=UPI0034E2D0F1